MRNDEHERIRICKCGKEEIKRILKTEDLPDGKFDLIAEYKCCGAEVIFRGCNMIDYEEIPYNSTVEIKKLTPEGDTHYVFGEPVKGLKEYEEMKSLNGFTNDYGEEVKKIVGISPEPAKNIGTLGVAPEPSAFLWTNPELKEMNEKLSDIIEILKYIAINIEKDEPEEKVTGMAFCKVCNSYLQTPGELERMECNLCSGKKG